MTGRWEEEKTDPMKGMIDVLLFLWCMYCYFCDKCTLISVIHALLDMWYMSCCSCDRVNPLTGWWEKEKADPMEGMLDVLLFL